MGSEESMIEHGYSSPKWMLKQLIVHSDPRLLKHAVLQVIDAMHDRDVTSFEILEMLAQYAATGKYEKVDYQAQVASDAIKMADELLLKYTTSTVSEDLTDEQEAEVEKFKDFLNGLDPSKDNDEKEDD